MNKEYLQRIAGQIKAELPDGYGFFLLAAPYSGAQSRASYISNMHREDAINVMKEFLIKAGAEEDWMKHLP
jgi:hypothetical protein